MQYNNNAKDPQSQRSRVLTISIDNPDFKNCSIHVNIINVPDKPRIHLPDGYFASYVEDSDAVLVSNVSVDIRDDDSNFLSEAMIWLSNPVYGANDRIFIPSSFSTMFDIVGNGSARINVTTISFDLPHPHFVSLLQNIYFQTNDQATNRTRQLYFTVEESPKVAGPSDPVVILIKMIPVNDRPVLTSTPLVTTSVLNNYLPETISSGFLPSHLINSSVVADVDSAFPLADDIIGLAIYNLSSGGIGRWIYWASDKWEDIGPVSECSPQFIMDNQRVQFLPTPSASKMNGTASFSYRVWDGKSYNVCLEETLRDDESEKLFCAI